MSHTRNPQYNTVTQESISRSMEQTTEDFIAWRRARGRFRGHQEEEEESNLIILRGKPSGDRPPRNQASHTSPCDLVRGLDKSPH